ncbi:MAG: hypothetical protein U9Q80_10790 [Bacillota bacterium]|nr:hypothetical protein [Bacillota bacterium]
MIKKVKDIMQEAFNQGHLANDEATLKDDVERLLKLELRKRKINDEELNIEAYLRQYEDGARYPYPGKQILLEGKATIEKILENYEEMNFFNAVKAAEKDLLDYSKDSEDVKEFFKNKRKHFDNAVEQIENFKLSETYVTDEEAIATIKEIKDIVKMPNPYREIHRLPELRNKFIAIFTELLEQESELVKGVVISNRESARNYLNQAEISENGKYGLVEKINSKFEKLMDELSRAKVFRDVVFKKDEASRAKDLLVQEIDAIEKQEKARTDGNNKVKDPGPVKEVKKVKKLNLTEYTKAFKDIESDIDLEDVVNKFRELLKEEMKKNDVIKFF